MLEAKPRILVADDEKFNRNMLAQLLRPLYTVILCKDGQQALEKANSEYPPELILLDIMMPEMDGYTTCNLLKQSPNTKDIPVIFVTSMQDTADEEKGLDIGAIDYIGKPFSPAIVLARIRNHLALSRAQKKLADAHAQLEEKNLQLEQLATRDSLTGINNRFSLDEALNRESCLVNRHDNGLSVLLVDLDKFKHINDSFGHLVGDDTLRHLAALLQRETRCCDIVGRWGGEEFLIICPETDLDGAMTLAEHLRESIERELFPNQLNITASFGVAHHIKDEVVSSLISRADKALYTAKEEGRNCVRQAEG